MPKYFDIISQNILDVDKDTHIYLIEIKNKGKESQFAIKAISEGLDKISCDPYTHATYYWPIDTSKLLAKQTDVFLFPPIVAGEKHLREEPLSLQEVIKHLKIDPSHEKPKKFNKQIGQQLLNEWSNDTFTLDNTHGNNVGMPSTMTTPIPLDIDTIFPDRPLVDDAYLDATIRRRFGLFSDGFQIIDEVDELDKEVNTEPH